MEPRPKLPKFWLLKTEPSTYSFETLLRSGHATWDGIRNPLARIHISQMNKGDLAWIYHSGDDRMIVGLAKITSAPSKDTNLPLAKNPDKPWLQVELKPLGGAKPPLPLSALKSEPVYSDLMLLKQSRLSVMPVSEKTAVAIAKATGLGNALERQS